MIYFYNVYPDPKTSENWGNIWVRWCEENCEGNWTHRSKYDPIFKVYFLFDKEEDAFAFTMRWV